MQSADHVQFCATVVRGFLTTSDDLFIRKGVALVTAEIRSERAKVAAVNANVGRVQVSVDVVVSRIAVFAFTDQVRQLS